MSNDISGYGILVRIVASRTFPVGFTVTLFSDDGDPVDMPSQQVADKAMGINGNLITWSKANPLTPTLAVVPNTEEDINLGILLEANRAGRGKTPARDLITMTVSYPDGSTETLNNGAITDGMLINSVSSAGRIKTKTYAFAFENRDTAK